jgi:hypothetical protein
MARKIGQIIRRGAHTWLMRVCGGRDIETKKRMYTHAVLLSALKQAIFGADAEGAALSLADEGFDLPPYISRRSMPVGAQRR